MGWHHQLEDIFLVGVSKRMSDKRRLCLYFWENLNEEKGNTNEEHQVKRKRSKQIQAPYITYAFLYTQIIAKNN